MPSWNLWFFYYYNKWGKWFCDSSIHCLWVNLTLQKANTVNVKPTKSKLTWWESFQVMKNNILINHLFQPLALNLFKIIMDLLFFFFLFLLRWHLSPSNPEQTDSWQDHSCHRHDHSCSGGSGVPGALQDYPRTQKAGVIQERLHELGPAFLCLLRAHRRSQTQGRQLHISVTACIWHLTMPNAGQIFSY